MAMVRDDLSINTESGALRCGKLVRLVALGTCALWISSAEAATIRMMADANLSETYTDNATQASSENARSGFVTDAGAGIRIEHQGPASALLLDYHAHRFSYANQSSLNNSQNLLKSYAKLEMLDKWFVFDARANITQQNRSAFAFSVAPEVASTSGNRVETTALLASPQVRGNISAVADYLVSLNVIDTRTRDSTLPRTRSADWIGRIKSTPSTGKLGWEFSGSASNIRNELIGKRDSSEVRTMIVYDIATQLRVSVSAGVERSDYLDEESQRSQTYGGGFDWTPSERTQITAAMQHRFFGNDHVFNFKHRTPLSAWSIVSSRGISNVNEQLAQSGARPITSLMNDLLSPVIADPVARAETAQRKLDAAGISAGGSEGFLTARPFVTKRHEASVVLLGMRNTVAVTFSQITRLRADQDAITLGTTTIVDTRQRGAGVSWAYKISPASTLTIIASKLQTEGLTLANQDSKQRLYSVFLSSQLGRVTFASIGLKRTHFDSTTLNSYRENALVCSLTARF